MPPANGARRVQLDFAPKAMERLETLKARSEAASYSEVIKTALRVYEALIDEADKGNEFMIKTRDGATGPFKALL